MKVESQLYPVRFGVASSAITPPVGSELSGYPFVDRRAEGVHDPLFTNAVVFGDGEDRVAIVSLDLIAISADRVAIARNQIHDQTGIAPERIMIFVTHTHSGPSIPIGTLFDEGVIGHPDAEYVAMIPDVITEVVTRAADTATLCRIGFDWGDVDPPVGKNRRNATGASDSKLPVVAVFSANGDLRALTLSVACHPTILQAENLHVTSDLAWGVRTGINRRLGESVIVLYATGSAGDQSTRGTRRAPSFEEAERLGDIIAAEAERVAKRLARRPVADAPVIPRSLSEQVNLPLRVLPELEDAIELARVADAELERLRNEGAPAPLVRTAEVTTFGAHHTVRYARQARERPLPREVAGEFQAISVGPARFLGLPVELFVELGLAIMGSAPGPCPMIVAYANGLLGYVPTAVAYAEGGYEPAVTLIGEGAGAILVQAATELLARLESMS